MKIGHATDGDKEDVEKTRKTTQRSIHRNKRDRNENEEIPMNLRPTLLHDPRLRATPIAPLLSAIPAAPPQPADARPRIGDGQVRAGEEIQLLRHWLASQIRRSREAFPRRTCRGCGHRSHYASMHFDNGWFCNLTCAHEHWTDPSF